MSQSGSDKKVGDFVFTRKGGSSNAIREDEGVLVRDILKLKLQNFAAAPVSKDLVKFA